MCLSNPAGPNAFSTIRGALRGTRWARKAFGFDGAGYRYRARRDDRGRIWVAVHSHRGTFLTYI